MADPATQPLTVDTDNLSDISEDSYTSLPGSPSREEDPSSRPFLCKWESCNTTLPSLPALVNHLNTDHFGLRRAKYSCEWDGCSRKGYSQPSRFALVSHMRSHTGEKPFYCTVPECERSFTRSDALGKHLRTVHETEVFKISKWDGAVKSDRDPIAEAKPDYPAPLKRAFENDEREESSLYLRIKRMDDGLLKLLNTPLDMSLSRPLGGGEGDFKDKAKVAGSDEDIFGPTTQSVLRGDGSFPNPTVPQLKQVFESLKRRLIWSLEKENELSKEHDRLTKERYQAWIENEQLLDKVLKRNLDGMDEEQEESSEKVDEILLWSDPSM